MRKNVDNDFLLAAWGCVASIIWVVILCLGLVLLLPLIAHGRDLGQYAQVPPDIRQWFNTLHSKKGLCCADADGYDAQWDTLDGQYRVFSPDGWVVVPTEAVVEVPNKSGVAKVWWETGRGGTRGVRCFLPGPQS